MTVSQNISTQKLLMCLCFLHLYEYSANQTFWFMRPNNSAGKEEIQKFLITDSPQLLSRRARLINWESTSDGSGEGGWWRSGFKSCKHFECGSGGSLAMQIAGHACKLGGISRRSVDYFQRGQTVLTPSSVALLPYQGQAVPQPLHDGLWAAHYTARQLNAGPLGCRTVRQTRRERRLLPGVPWPRLWHTNTA